MQYAPPPTEEQLARVADGLGASSLRYSHRIEGGLSSTMEVLVDGPTRLVLRRYGSWYEERGEDVAARETRALEILQKANIPAPAPIWIDTSQVFEEPAIIISFVDGQPDLTPSHPFEWAETLASVVARIHEVRLDDDDKAVFGSGAGEDIRRISDKPELVLEHPLGEDLLRRRVLLGALDLPTDEVFSHTDLWPGNSLWKGDELLAVIDWESPAVGAREMDVAYCSLDIRYLGMDKVADHFLKSYREISGTSLSDIEHWEAIGLCRPMPDIARWVPAWKALGRDMSADKARDRYTAVLEDFLARTA